MYCYCSSSSHGEYSCTVHIEIDRYIDCYKHLDAFQDSLLTCYCCTDYACMYWLQLRFIIDIDISISSNRKDAAFSSVL